MGRAGNDASSLDQDWIKPGPEHATGHMKRGSGKPQQITGQCAVRAGNAPADVS